MTAPAPAPRPPGRHPNPVPVTRMGVPTGKGYCGSCGAMLRLSDAQVEITGL